MATRDEERRVNVGFGQSRPVTSQTRQPGIGIRALRGDFQVGRPERSQSVNVGMGGARSVGASASAVQRPDFSNVRTTPQPSFGNVTSGASTAPAPARPQGAKPDFSNVSTATPGPRPLDPNTFTGSNGVTQRVAPAASAGNAAAAQPAVLRTLNPTPVIARPSTAPQVQATTERTLAGQRELTRDTRAMGAEILNPMSADAELMRRLENSQRSYMHKGSPQARNLVGQAIMAQMSGRTAAAAQGQQAGNQTLQQGAGLEAGANESHARRRLDADMFNADGSYRERALQADIQRPTLQTDASGNLVSISGTSATPVTSADGAQVRMPQPAVPGALTPKDYLDTLTSERDMLLEAVQLAGDKAPQATQQRLMEINAEIGQQFSGGQPQGGGAARVSSKAELDALPKGTRYIGPDGVMRTK